MNKKELLAVWNKFAEKNDFKLNPDKKHVDIIVQGVLKNEQETGLKLCPCRLGDGTKKRNLELLCPCNFKIHDTWKTHGRCWCGLFIKK